MKLFVSTAPCVVLRACSSEGTSCISFNNNIYFHVYDKLFITHTYDVTNIFLFFALFVVISLD